MSWLWSKAILLSATASSTGHQRSDSNRLPAVGLNSSAWTSPALLDVFQVPFCKWIKARWPEPVTYAEIPTEMLMLNGQLLQGHLISF